MHIGDNVQVSFASRYNPIRPFTIKTKKGKLWLAEASEKELANDKFLEKLTRFFCKNFASSTNDPSWRVFTQVGSNNYNNAIKNLKMYYIDKLRKNNENLTLFLAKDKNNKIQGACFAYNLDALPVATDSVYYIDSIAVNPVYRKFKLGRLLLEKTLDSLSEKVGDVFLIGDKLASGFYKAIGFRILEGENPAEKTISDYIARRRADYPAYTDLFTKNLKTTDDSWCVECAKKINSSV